MNVKLLRQVQKFLLAEPRRFDMGEWITSLAYADGVLANPPCGTALCIAGAAYAISSKLKLDHTCVESVVVSRGAVEALQLEGPSPLFFVCDWPEKFRTKYHNAETPLQRAKVGVARIEHFIKTGGKE